MDANSRILTNLGEVDALLAQLLDQAPILSGATAVRERLAGWIFGALRRHVLSDFDCFVPGSIPEDAASWVFDAAGRGAPVGEARLGDEALALLSLAVAKASAKAALRPIGKLQARLVCERCAAEMVAGIVCGGLPSSDACSERLFCPLPDGWSWVELLDANALVREGSLMRHCSGTFSEQVASKAVRIFSLRSPFGRPRLTAEVRDGSLRQLRGRAQSLPKLRDADRIERFVHAAKHYDGSFSVHACHDLAEAGFLWLDSESKLAFVGVDEPEA